MVCSEAPPSNEQCKRQAFADYEEDMKVCYGYKKAMNIECRKRAAVRLEQQLRRCDGKDVGV
jgi:hypothetical protein